MSSQRKDISIADKLEALAYLDNHTYRQTAVHFKVPADEFEAFKSRMKRCKRKRSQLQALKDDPKQCYTKRARLGGADDDLATCDDLATTNNTNKLCESTIYCVEKRTYM